MKRLLLLLLAMLTIFGCSQMEEAIREKTTEPKEQRLNDAAQTRAGSSTLDNPYSLSKVQQAYNAISSSLGLPAKTIEASEHYVKFYAADSLQYMTLCDLGVELFEYPMHLELTDAEEQAYADQDPVEGMWFWTTVSPYFVYPQGIQHEKLDDIYIQQTGGTATRAGETQMSDDVWSNVLDKAFELSGYEPEPQTRGAKWFPSASVKYITDHPKHYGEECPLEGVKVRVSQGINWAVVYTDANGNTGNIERNSGRLFKKPVNYKIKWENSRWNIRSGRNGQAKTWGPKNSRTHWSVVFQGNDINTKYAIAHKALYNYVYNNDDWNLTKNLTISNINKLNTGVIDKAHNDGKTTGKFNGVNPWFTLNAVRLWLKYGNGNYTPNWEVEGTMYHELGHASHWRALRIDKDGDGRRWDMGKSNIREPFAEFVSSCFMRSVYPNHEHKYPSSGDYHGLGEWLTWQGFTPSQVETIMCNDSYEDWRRVAKNMNVTDPAIVDMIFDNPYRVMRVNITNPITGTDKPAVKTNITYSVPSSLPSGVTFTGWTLPTGGGYSVTSGSTTSRSVTLKFTAYGTYTLSANFTLPNGTSYAATKQITVAGTPPKTPVIGSTGQMLTLDEKKWTYIPLPGKAYWVQRGTTVYVYIDSTIPGNYDNSATYEWDAGSLAIQQVTGPYFQRVTIPNNAYGIYEVRCRAYKEGTYSEWGSLWLRVR